jgi:hypothetical protein
VCNQMFGYYIGVAMMMMMNTDEGVMMVPCMKLQLVKRHVFL